MIALENNKELAQHFAQYAVTGANIEWLQSQRDAAAAHYAVPSDHGRCHCGCGMASVGAATRTERGWMDRVVVRSPLKSKVAAMWIVDRCDILRLVDCAT